MFNHVQLITPVHLNTTEGPKGRFYVAPNGSKYPSVTTVLGAKEKPHLKQWRNMLGDSKADAEMTRASTRGTAVHLMIERHINNDATPTKNHKPEHVAEFNSVRLMLKKINNVLIQEAALYSDIMKIAGRVDCIAEYEGVLAVVDFKTSTNDKKESMVYDYFLQTTAYALMVGEMYNIQIDDLVIIMSVERGIVPLVFRGKVEDYVRPLLERINTYHTKAGE